MKRFFPLYGRIRAHQKDGSKGHELNRHQQENPQALSRSEWDVLSWSHLGAPGQTQPDKNWLDWLTDDSSLTRRRKHASDQRFQVQLLQQCLIRPALNEARLLGIDSQQYALIRQVYLKGFNQPWVFARTVIPLPTLHQGNRHLMLLGNRSLGSVLFKNAHTQRASMEITQHVPTFSTPFVWGRRSTFNIYKAPLLVTELFLEPFRQHQQLKPLTTKR